MGVEIDGRELLFICQRKQIEEPKGELSPLKHAKVQYPGNSKEINKYVEHFRIFEKNLEKESRSSERRLNEYRKRAERKDIQMQKDMNPIVKSRAIAEHLLDQAKTEIVEQK
ncbi:hypothetical protein ACOME3_007898 [Neoechinorhynchus agilis]